MRRSKLRAQELEEAELAEHNRQQSRKDGLSMVEVRDRGWVRLSNGSVLEWPVDRELREGEARSRISRGSFKLNGRLYDSDEFRKWERWA